MDVQDSKPINIGWTVHGVAWHQWRREEKLIWGVCLNLHTCAPGRLTKEWWCVLNQNPGNPQLCCFSIYWPWQRLFLWCFLFLCGTWLSVSMISVNIRMALEFSLWWCMCRDPREGLQGLSSACFAQRGHAFVFVCLCTHVLRGWCLQLRLTDKMTSPKSADGCLAPEVLLSSFFLFYIPAPLLRRPPSLPALIFLSEGLWQKREPDSWHGGRGGGGSRGILEVIYPATLHSERPQVVVHFALLCTLKNLN